MAERHSRLRGIAAALTLVGVLAGSAAGGFSAESARGSAAAGKSRARIEAVPFLRRYASRRLIARTRRRLEARPSPQPVRGPILPPSVAAPSLGGSGGFGVSLDNAEYLDAATRDREVDSMAAMGADWIRIDVKWSDVQWHGRASFNWSKYDPLVDSARARGLSVLANLAYSPTWARPGGTTDKFGPNTDDRRNAYAAFTEAAVRHFAGRISHWELWNEPNMSTFWAPRPNAAHYAALIRDAYDRMKAADPGAYVLAGATSPADSDGTRIDEVAFISAVYANGGRRRFDGWSHHPYTGNPSFAHPQNAWWQMTGTSPSIRSVMAANGDGAKHLWGTEFGPPTSGAPNAKSEPAQAAQITEAYTTWNAYGWSGPLFVYTQRDKRPYGASTDSFDYHGMLRHDFSQKPAWGAYRALAT